MRKNIVKKCQEKGKCSGAILSGNKNTYQRSWENPGIPWIMPGFSLNFRFIWLSVKRKASEQAPCLRATETMGGYLPKMLGIPRSSFDNAGKISEFSLKF